MSIEKHDLINELPQYRDLIDELKTSDQNFARLFAQYHNVDHEIHRLETGAESADEAYLNVRKKMRLKLKDQLLDIIKHHELNKA